MGDRTGINVLDGFILKAEKAKNNDVKIRLGELDAIGHEVKRLTTECDRLKDEKRVLESKVGELRARMTEIKTQAQVYKKSMEHTKEACKEIKAEKEQWKSIADKLAEFIKEDYQVEDWSDQNCTCKICELIKSYNAVKGE